MIARRLFICCAVVLVSISLLAFTTFAVSPSLEDATISFSVKGYYTQYAQSVTYTLGSNIHSSDGSITTGLDNSYKLSSEFSVFGGGTLFVYRSDSSTHIQQIFGFAFYDSEHNVIPIDSHDYDTYFIPVPELAVTARVSIWRTGTSSAAASFSKPIAAPQSGVNSNNYQYLWGEISNITIDADGFITLPYQTFSYTWFWLDFDFFDSTFQFSNIAFTFYSVYTGGYFTGERLLDYTRLSVDSYYKADNGDITFDEIGYTDSGDNPYRFIGQIPYERFCGFRLYVETEQVSTSIKVKVYDFELDGEGVAVLLKTQDALNELDELSSHLDLPTPDTSSIYNNLNNVVVQLNDSNFGGFDWFGPSGGLYITMCITTFTFAALGYIIFGKRG